MARARRRSDRESSLPMLAALAARPGHGQAGHSYYPGPRSGDCASRHGIPHL